MKQIIIHLGPPKTGTTSIQAFLSSARDALAASGVRYTDAGRIQSQQTVSVQRQSGIKRVTGPGIAHHLLPWSVLGDVVEPKADEVWNALCSEIAECPQPTVVVSSEAFSRLDCSQLEYVRARLDGYSVIAVAYVRNPLSRMLSDYKQRVKIGMYYTPFSHFIRDVWHLIENFDGFIDRWDAVFGHGSAIIRDFDAAVASDGLETDFARLITSEPHLLRAYHAVGRGNVSPSNQTIRTQRLINRLEALLGRPGRLRRQFAAARKVVALKGPAALQRLLVSGAALETVDDVAFIESLAAQRYASLLARCREIDPQSPFDAG